MNKTDFLPCLPLRDIVVFPGMIAPLFVGREKSIKALNEVMKTNKKIVLVTQKNAEIDDFNQVIYEVCVFKGVHFVDITHLCHNYSSL